MDRAELLQAIAWAASAAASGANDMEAQRELDGKKFEVRVRFGCGGPGAALDQSSTGWVFDEKTRVLRVRATPTIAADDPLVAELGMDEVEAVEGFWFRRPWLLDAACPTGEAAVPAAKTSVVPQGPPPPSARVGIAQFFTSSDPRTARRDHRPYQAVKTLDEGKIAGAHGFDLVLSGRLRALPDKRVIHCSLRGADNPPDCLASADFDRVWIEDPDTSEIVAQWTTS
jgi:hypothetical protein